MRKRWVNRALKGSSSLPDVERKELLSSVKRKADLIAARLGLSDQIALLCALRGCVSPEDAKAFLNDGLAQLPDPFLMRDMDKGATRVARAIMNNEKMLMMTDFDVDGQSSGAVLTEFLLYHNADASFFCPDRVKNGYGLSASAIQEAAGAGVTLIISADCGISNVEEAKLAKSLGIDLIITDHHLVPEVKPDAYAVINPHQEDCDFPEVHKDLCGAGVAFYLTLAVRQKLRVAGFYNNFPEPDVRKYLDIVALATVADIVPLAGANRIMTRAGLKLIEAGGRIGIKALGEVAGVKKVSSGTIGFQYAPRLNAVGRIDDANEGVRLLLSQSEDEARELAGKLNLLNTERKEIENKILKEALEIVESRGRLEGKTLVVANKGWVAGVIGIVGSRLVELYNRPTVMIAIGEDGIGKCSGRSITGYHLQQGFTRCADTLLGFGGHSMAAGASIHEDMIEEFSRQLEADAQKQLTDEDMVPVLYYDMVTRISDNHIESITALSKLEPFGMGNPSVQFCSVAVKPERARIVGGSHLSFEVEQKGKRLKCIAFQMGDRLPELLNGQPIDIIYRPTVNEWNGSFTPQAEVRDFRATLS